MAKKPRLTVEDLLQQCDDDNLDPDEPVMEGSDDEFSGLEVDEDDTEDRHTAPSRPASPLTAPSSSGSADTSATSSASCDRSTRSGQVNCLNLHDFSSPVVPTVDIS